MMAIICYAVAFVVIIFSIPSMMQGLIGILFNAVTFNAVGSHISLLAGGCISWMAIAFAWKWAEGAMLPLTIPVAGLAFLFIYGWLQRKELTYQSNQAMAAEAWSILIVTGLILWRSDSVRWY